MLLGGTSRPLDGRVAAFFREEAPPGGLKKKFRPPARWMGGMWRHPFFELFQTGTFSNLNFLTLFLKKVLG
jgi:hypothetical protein